MHQDLFNKIRDELETEMQDEMEQIFHQYISNYSQRNINEVLKFISPRLSGFGTGQDEQTFGDGSYIDLYKREAKQVPKNLEITIHYEHFQPLSKNCFIVAALIDITAEIEKRTHTLNARLTCVFHKTTTIDNHWYLEHKHLSSPLLIQKDGESAPISELKRQKIELERLVKEKTEKLTKTNKTLIQKNSQLEKALQEVSNLQKLIPICANCKKLRNDEGYWQELEQYFLNHNNLQFTHGLCEECMHKLYPDLGFKEKK